jgi:uncharacterized protein YndB with AHSA1/START domain
MTTVTFTEHGGKTTLTLRTRASGIAARVARMLEGMEQGWTQSVERLQKLVAEDATSTADREIVTTRVFDAPRELVFNAWTDPKHLAQWWGPNGFTSTIHQMDVRPGGLWRLTMHGPDGVDYKNESVFTEVVKPERLAYTHVSPRFHATVTFEEECGKTKLTMRMLFETVLEHDRVVNVFGAVEGAKQTLARLHEHLAKM